MKIHFRTGEGSFGGNSEESLATGSALEWLPWCKMVRRVRYFRGLLRN